jgi:hypothetical protein
MLSARGEKVLLILHTTLDSGISSDTCEGLTKQRTNHLQEMKTLVLVHFGTFLFGFEQLLIWILGKISSASRKG